jgi:hypothetical protein
MRCIWRASAADKLMQIKVGSIDGNDRVRCSE